MGKSREVALDRPEEKDDENTTVRNDPSAPITELFCCGNLIWGPNINQDVQADFLQHVAHTPVFPLTSSTSG